MSLLKCENKAKQIHQINKMNQCFFYYHHKKDVGFFFLFIRLFKLNVKYHVFPRDSRYTAKLRVVNYKIIFILMLITYQITVL